jgi:hypothetical protein
MDKMQTVRETTVDESGNYLEGMIGSDADMDNRKEEKSERDALVRKGEWKELEKREQAEGTSIRRGNQMRDGFHAGYESAAEDFVNGKASVEHFETLRTARDLTDFYALGFELGYFRKLAEICIA